MIRNLVTALALSLLLCGAASAQTQTVYNIPAVKATYSATAIGIAPVASTTDFFTLTGSATKTVRVLSASCNGTSTAEATHVVVALKRSTANSAGTSSNLTEVPLDSSLSAATATALSYTANPTTGALVGNIEARQVTTTEAAAAVVQPKAAEFVFGQGRQAYPVTLRGTAQVFALNGNAASFAAGTSLNCSVQWVEE